MAPGPHNELLNMEFNVWESEKAATLHMMTSSIGNIFRVTGPIVGESTGDRWI